MLRWVIGLLLLLAGIGALILNTKSSFQALNQIVENPQITERRVTINSKSYLVEVVTDPLKQAEGLSQRASLPRDRGMLFVFSPTREATFWMKGMLFPIDIVWIRNSRVSGVDRNLPIPITNDISSLPIYPSPGEIDFALETNAGETEDIKVGDYVELSTFSHR